MLRFNLIGFLLFFVVSNSYSQLEKDPKATEILKGVSEKYKSYKSVTSDFKIIIEDQKNKTKETQSGKISIKGSMYRLTLSDQEVISDGKTVWTYLKEANEVQINEPSAKSGSITPNNIFTLYESGFGTRFNGEKNIGGKVYYIIDLVPEDTKKSFFKVQLNINKNEKQVSSAKVFQKNGTFLYYSIDKFKTNSIESDSIFTFNKASYPGVEVIDLR
jgi:outer membrane lipoprotein-sorting protein